MKFQSHLLIGCLCFFLSSCTDSSEASEASEEQESMDSMETMETMDSMEPMDSMETMESMKPMDSMKSAEYGTVEGLEMSNVSSFANFVFGGQPTEADLEALKAKGVTRIVDLRTVGEDRGYDESAVCEELGLTYVPLPFSPQNLDESVINGILEELKQDASNGETKTLVHCASGNRVHLLFSLHRVREDGVDLEQAIAGAQSAGMNDSVAGLVRQLAAKE